MSKELKSPPADPIKTMEAAVLLGMSQDGVRRLRVADQLGDYYVDHRTNPASYIYSRNAIQRAAEERRKAGEIEEELHSPMEYAYMEALRDLGGVVESESGTCTRLIAARTSYENVSMAARALRAHGLIESEVRGKRTFRVALTREGLEWCHENLQPPEPRTAEPEPEPEPEAQDVAGTIAAALAVPDEQEAPEEEDARPGPPVDVLTHDAVMASTNGSTEVSPSAIAHALLRQTVRVLNDSDTATITAERDALRAHNEVMAQRLAVLSVERDTYAQEARDARQVLHRIEMELTPLLVGTDAKFDWLDATTRVELLRLVGEAARWASSGTEG